MIFRAGRVWLPTILAVVISAQSVVAETHDTPSEGISPAETAIADMLITLADLELRLTRAGLIDALPAPPAGGDLLNRVAERLALLQDIEAKAPPPPPAAPEPAPVVVAEGDIAPDGPDETLDLTAAVEPVEVVIPPVAPPAPVLPDADSRDDFIAVSLDGSSLHSLTLDSLSPDETATLPDSTTCEDLGDWFQTLSLRKEFNKVFVIEGDYVRICRQLGADWRIKRATNRDRAHLVQVAR